MTANEHKRTQGAAELAYLRDRNAGRLAVYEISRAHVYVQNPRGTDRVEIMTTNDRPVWLDRSRHMRPNEARKAIMRSTGIVPQFKAVYLGMIDAGAAQSGKEGK